MDEEHGQGEKERSGERSLNVPLARPSHFARNFISQAVCELRFPTIFEIEDARPPASFWKVVRKDFPNHTVLNNVQVGPASIGQANAHQFSSKKSRWQIILKSAAVALQTSKYDSFEEFEEQLRTLIEAAKSTIDSDFFTRVGLRYINALPCKPNDVEGWVNPSLVGPLTEGIYGDVSVHTQQVRGTTDCGGFYFQHGITADKKGYLLDYDFYREEVNVVDALATVRKLHELEFSLFSWSLDDRSRAHLGSPQGAKK